jgi:hypothetical protein
MSKKFIIILVLTVVAFDLFPLAAQAFQLVPCGMTVSSQHPATSPETAPCTFQHLVILLVRMINYLITMAAVVAMYYVLLAGFNLVTAMGNEEKIKKNKEGVAQAVVGFAIILLAFVFVNLLINGLFGQPGVTREWWNLNCLYNITKPPAECIGVPPGPGSS